MATKLVIVESPAKAKTINKILGKDYIVKSSMGHIRDLPVKRLGVDVDKDFEPSYEVVKTRVKVVKELTDAAKKCDEIYLAPDPDREGEAIAWHLQELLSKVTKDKPFFRIQYNEITPRAVRAAFDHPSVLDMNRVNAQQARRVLDRIVGYKVSPLLWRRVKRGLSAGRVQSVALRLVCEREKEVVAFVPEPYWILGAMVRKLVAPLDTFAVKLTRMNDKKIEIKTPELAAEIQSDLDGCKLTVKEVKTRTVNRRAYPPFITSTLQQAASTFCGFSPRRTMSVAQKLYEGVDLGSGPEGLITYMRTDSVAISADALTSCRAFISKQYGDEYLPEKPNVYKSRSSAQEAHEAIRPADVMRTPGQMKPHLEASELKLYRLIWERFVASQMPPAKVEQSTAVILSDAASSPKGSIYQLQATASATLFLGHRRVSGELEKKKDDSDAIEALPELVSGEPLTCLEVLSESKETKPPARFTEASLVKQLEANGVGRPSTYAQIITTLQERTYVVSERRSLKPTELGMQTSDFLTESLGQLFNVSFTADMEAQLDNVEGGTLEWTAMLAAFYGPFTEWMEKSKGPAAEPEKIRRIIEALTAVKEWAPVVKRGRRTYSDEKFTGSIEEMLTEDKAISMRQFEALGKIAARYRDQVPVLSEILTDIGLAELLLEPAGHEPDPVAMRKLGLLATVELDEGGRKFIDSLREQVESGRRLSPNQDGALNRTIMRNTKQIENFDAVREELGLEEVDIPEDTESGPLLEAVANVAEWKPAVKRGKREFDDKSFYDSLNLQFGQRGHLSDRQRAALKRLARRYREQIPGFEALAKTYDIAEPKPKKPKAE